MLDFGLAKAFAGDGSAPDSSQLPTVTDTELRPGAILGTPAYMSPEQARGQAIDKRTDIWAFGCVLYEMLTGRRAFPGETISDTIAAILEREPAWTALPQSTPASVRRLLAQCLDKDPKRRLRDIGQARIELDDAMAQPSARDTRSGVSVPTPLSRRPSEAGAGSATARVPRWVAVAAGLVLLLLVAALAGVTWRSLGRAPAAEPRVVRLTLALPAGQELVTAGVSARGDLARRDQHRLCGESWRRDADLPASRRQPGGHGARRHRRGQVSVLLSRREVDRVLRGAAN